MKWANATNTKAKEREKVLHNKKECWFCGRINDLEVHHIFHGSANRKKSEQYKDICTVYLCHRCHNEPPEGVHFNKYNDLMLMQEAQRKFEEKEGHAKFMAEFGKNYL